MSEYPQKEFYRLNEVCQYTDTQPYVLRFWESEFPQLRPGKSNNGQRVYTGEDIALVRRIKELLYEEEYTLEGARKALNTESSRGRKSGGAKRRSSARKTEAEVEIPAERNPAPRAGSSLEPDSVPRQRYQDAIDEIDHLRLQLKDAEKNLHRAETGAEEAGKQAERQRQRAQLAIERLEKLLEILS